MIFFRFPYHYIVLGLVHVLDFTEPIIDVNALISNWVLAIDVLSRFNHEQDEAMIMYNILQISTLGVVLSWADEEQAEAEDINPQSADYVKCIMYNIGFVYASDETEVLRQSAGTLNDCCPSLSNSSFVFLRGWRGEGVPVQKWYEPRIAAAYNELVGSVYDRDAVVSFQREYTSLAKECE